MDTSPRDLSLRCAECGAETGIGLDGAESTVGQIRVFVADHRSCQQRLQIVERIPNQREIVRAIR